MNEIEIALVEDNADDVEMTLRALRENHLANRTQVLRDGDEALDFVFCRGKFAERSFLNLPKLILLDLRLPKLDGLEVLAVLKADARTESVPVLVLTSSDNDRDLLRSHDLGVNGCVRKPIDFAELRAVLRDAGLGWLLDAESTPSVVRNTALEPVP